MTMRTASRLGPGLLLLGTILTGCATETPLTTRSSKPQASLVAIGKPAPEIEGKDVDATPFKLSDYRGKVVMLDFWGNF
jgi:hypothetical protein